MIKKRNINHKKIAKHISIALAEYNGDEIEYLQGEGIEEIDILKAFNLVAVKVREINEDLL